MKIIIPMSGLGSRFINAGYTDPKPLIQVHGKPIIQHVTELFPGENDFVFICREEHIANTEMRQILEGVRPGAQIISIPGHKLGPVHAVSQVFDELGDAEHIIISYCDFYQTWDYSAFKKRILQSNYSGAIPCYTGFHPHLLHKDNLYAGCRVNNKLELLEIREKHSYTHDKSLSHHSGGIYYFRNMDLVKKYFQKAIDIDYSLNGEFYVSMIYQLMIEDGHKVLVYDDVEHFCQWGTPSDLEEYLHWSGIFKSEAQE